MNLAMVLDLSSLDSDTDFTNSVGASLVPEPDPFLKDPENDSQQCNYSI